jgi:hypothetical protein
MDATGSQERDLSHIDHAGTLGMTVRVRLEAMCAILARWPRTGAGVDACERDWIAIPVDVALLELSRSILRPASPGWQVSY